MKRLFERRWQIALFRRIAPWISRLTYSCAEMSRLSSATFERRLTPVERFKRLLHFLICDWCRRYASQLRFLRRAARRLGGDCDHQGHHRLPSEARTRIRARLAEANHRPPPPDAPAA